MNVDLEMLMARLRWPIACTRWWTMQELATLLLSQQYSITVEQRLRSELRDCRLEAETLEILCVFWIAALQGYSPSSTLEVDVTRPSLLAGLLIGELGEQLKRRHNPPLEIAPADFQIPVDFHSIHDEGVPYIYMGTLERLEKKTGLHLTRQFAFEWALTAKLYGDSYQRGSVDHFVRPVGDRISGGFVNRTILRVLTAYQRTLNVAMTFWGMPTGKALALALHASPLCPALALLRPSRPAWIPTPQGYSADACWVEGYLASLDRAISAAQAGGTLLAFSGPVHVSRFEIAELTVTRWRGAGEVPSDAEALAGRFRDRERKWEYGSTVTDGIELVLPACEVEAIRDFETQACPMAAVLGFDRYGYLNRDLFPSRLRYPLLPEGEATYLVTPDEGRLIVSDAHDSFAEVSYWNAGWGPTHPRGMEGGLCGTALIGDAERLSSRIRVSPEDRFFYLWNLTCYLREHGYGTYVEAVGLHGCLPV